MGIWGCDFHGFWDSGMQGFRDSGEGVQASGIVDLGIQKFRGSGICGFGVEAFRDSGTRDLGFGDSWIRRFGNSRIS